MTTKQFIVEKNKLVKEVTGLILVPEYQIIDLPYVWLAECGYLSSTNCPYCVSYKECLGCPMSVSNNECNLQHSTYKSVIVRMHELHIGTVPGLLELTQRYNKENR